MFTQLLLRLKLGCEASYAKHEWVRTAGGSPETNLPMKAAFSVVKFGGHGTWPHLSIPARRKLSNIPYITKPKHYALNTSPKVFFDKIYYYYHIIVLYAGHHTPSKGFR